jgi:hypothetical protein
MESIDIVDMEYLSCLLIKEIKLLFIVFIFVCYDIVIIAYIIAKFPIVDRKNIIRNLIFCVYIKNR